MLLSCRPPDRTRTSESNSGGAASGSNSGGAASGGTHAGGVSGSGGDHTGGVGGGNSAGGDSGAGGSSGAGGIGASGGEHAGGSGGNHSGGVSGASAGGASGGGVGGASGGGVGGAGSACVPGGSCGLPGGCWENGEGTVSCKDGLEVCTGVAKPYGAPCGNDRVCTGDGECIAAPTSCASAATPGCSFVTVEGGEPFTMGQAGVAGATPVQAGQQVGAFVIDAYEVTVARFRLYWDAGHPGFDGPIVYPGGYEVVPWTVPSEPATGHPAYNWSPTPAAREDYPINRVTWHTALAFCLWDGGRLPTEAEWEYVARYRPVDGLSPGRTYPWGEDAPTCDLAHLPACNASRMERVGQKPANGGVFNLAGNAREWTADAFQTYDHLCWADQEPPLFTCQIDDVDRVLRGGSYGHDEVRAAHRQGFTGVSAANGVRCVRDLVE